MTRLLMVENDDAVRWGSEYDPNDPEQIVPALGCHRFTDEACARLPFFLRLLQVGLRGYGVTDVGAKYFEQPSLTSLEVLELGGTGITGQAMASLAKLVNLRVLDVARTRVDDAGLEKLKPLTALECLNLDGTAVTAAGLVHLKGFTKLKELYLGLVDFTQQGKRKAQEVVMELLNLPALTVLGLHGTGVGDAAIIMLTKIATLTDLIVSGNPKVTKDSIKQFQHSPLKRLYREGTGIKISDRTALEQTLGRPLLVF